MARMILTKTRIKEGVWEGVLAAEGPLEDPELLVTHLGEPVGEVTLERGTGEGRAWAVRIALPPHLLADGVQTILIDDAVTGERLSSFAIITGEALEDDLRAEVDLLRAELDMLKRAFRRHCVETG